ncbi:MAG: DUF3109 family protein [Saprospirales bacterium]|nr:MAG: DUF3109 family protein [Saprospirales bacterium]
MILLDNLLIHPDVLKEAFTCNLNACKGACCSAGDYGAPLDIEEEEKINEILEVVMSYLPEKNQSAIKNSGSATFFKGMSKRGTILMENGSCAFLIQKPGKIGKCAFEKAWEEGETDFRKPISCHLYPIRIEKNEVVGMDYINYDRWEICSAACVLGKSLKVPVFEFCSEALERKYGPEIMERLRELKKALDSDNNM